MRSCATSAAGMSRVVTLLLFAFALPLESGISGFITRSGDRLMENGSEFRFVSFNIPCLHYAEDEMTFDRTNPWRLPDPYEIEDGLESVRQAGGRVVRTYVLSVRRPDDGPGVPRHVPGPGLLNEEAFRALDCVIETAERKGIRLILPLVDNWTWWGGRAELAGFRGLDKDAFWTDRRVVGDFKELAAAVLTRMNTRTGRAYRDEPAILAWETGNELQSPAAWTSEIASFLHELDPNHLVMDGFHASVLRPESIDDPAVDIVTTHHYPRTAEEMIRDVTANRRAAAGRKPYIVGEFGFLPTEGVAAFLDTLISGGVSGALVWSLRNHSRDGGFYWHSEPFGGDRYKAYHWPGFASGDAYDETALVGLIRRSAFRIRGLEEPPLPVPEPPALLPVSDCFSISWRGSAGASGYRVERASAPDGPWTVLADSVSDAAAPHRPLFNDRTAEIGRAYRYRVSARNRSGLSAPSGPSEPVFARRLALTDEMEDAGRMAARSPGCVFVTNESRNAKEDFSRLRGGAGDWVVYRVPGAIEGWTVDAFASKGLRPLSISVSADGVTFAPAASEFEEFPKSGADYAYWIPMRFSADPADSEGLPAGTGAPGAVAAKAGSPERPARTLRLEFTAEAQIARVEVRHGR